MRVIAGVAKGHELVAPPGLRVRPTAGRVRRTLMDILAPRTAGRAWLDLFAGSGAVGVEALSRGARRVVFVEVDPRALRALYTNLERTRLAAGAEVWPVDVMRALEELSRQGRRFDVVFADPPYGRGLVDEAVRRVAAAGVLAPGGVVAVQHSARECPVVPEAWRLVRRVGFGETALSLLAPVEVGDGT